MVLSDAFWKKARFLVTEYDGAATEIFVLDLPASQLPKVTNVLAELPDLEIDGYCHEYYGEPRTFSTEWHQRLERFPESSFQHSLLSARGEREHLQSYLENGITPQTFDVEFVFWNNLTFSPDLTEAEYKAELSRLVGLAEGCREGHSGSPCILSAEHNGDPRRLLHSEYAVVW